MRSVHRPGSLAFTVSCLIAVVGCQSEDTTSGALPSDDDVCFTNPDADQDGWASVECGGYDCDDDDDERSPGMYEICEVDDFDEDCDLSTPGYRDDDGDGYIDADCKNLDSDADGGVASEGLDCDDSQPGVHPGLHEACNGVDDDCDGEVDEDVLVPSYRDDDGDGYGRGKASERCPGLPHFSTIDGDCDDDNALIHPDAFRCAADSDDGADIDVCERSGDFTAGRCPKGDVCAPQPNGTGVCLAAPGTSP